MGVKQAIKSLDAFPRAEEHLLQKTQSGALGKLIKLSLIIRFIWFQFIRWLYWSPFFLSKFCSLHNWSCHNGLTILAWAQILCYNIYSPPGMHLHLTTCQFSLYVYSNKMQIWCGYIDVPIAKTKNVIAKHQNLNKTS